MKTNGLVSFGRGLRNAAAFLTRQPTRAFHLPLKVRSRTAFAALTLLAGAGVAHAQAVLLNGLTNPRGLAVGPDGAVYITQSGMPFTPTGSTPMIAGATGPLYYGTGGSILSWKSAAVTTIVSGLPEAMNGNTNEVAGAQGIAVDTNGDIYFTLGLGANPNNRTGTPFSALGTLMKISAGTNTPTLVTDLAAFEAANNPAGGPVDSNPFQLALTSNGILVADAGGNDILRVNGSTVSLVTTLAGLPSGAEPVPTGVTPGTGNLYYVSQLTGFPFTPGASTLFSGSGSSLAPLATGFTNAIDVERGPDGMLYLLEFAHFGLLSGNTTGGLWRIDPVTGEKTLLMTDGLVLPTALALGQDGTIYVTNYGAIPGAGQLISIAPVPEPATYGLIGAAVLGFAVWRRRRK